MMTMTKAKTKKKKILVFSIFTLTLAAAAAIFDIFSESSFWKKTKKKTIQLLKEEEEEEEEVEKPNPGGGGGSTTSTLLPDRISELPKEILVHILGFLEMDEFLIGTSLVSTKWRNLWKSVSTLKFPSCTTSRRRRTDDDDDSVVVDNGGGGGGGITNTVETYQNFVDHVLRLRDSQASSIRIFKYDCVAYSKGGYDYLERLHNFIVSAAVNQGAQEIRILCSYFDESSDINIHFNPSIFTSGLLKKFTFDILILTNDFLIRFPRSMCCSSTQLTHLSLSGIRLPEGDDAAQLHLVCPLLETFRMLNCYSEHLKVLDISAPKLNTLSIYNCKGGCRIEIRTPNLTSLVYSGRVYVDCFTENLPRIADARLDLAMETGMMEKTTSFAIKLLKGLTSAQSLTLGGLNSFLEVFSQDTLKDLLTPFTSLRNLWLFTRCNISSIHGMVHLLNSCNSVEKFVWNVDPVVEVEGDEHLMLPQCRLSHLKHVHIKRLHGHENEIEFVKFLLKSSVVLEEIIIKTTKNSPKQSIEENLKQFMGEEPSFRSIKLYVLEEEF